MYITRLMSTNVILMISLYTASFLAWLLWYILYIWLLAVDRIDITINLIQFLNFKKCQIQYCVIIPLYFIWMPNVFMGFFFCIKNLVLHVRDFFFWYFHIQSFRTGSVSIWIIEVERSIRIKWFMNCFVEKSE